MIVYGDHPIHIDADDFLVALRRRCADAPVDLDEARVRLVLAGQLEQAAEDVALPWAPHCRSLTALLAADFVARMWGAVGCGQYASRVHQQLDGIAQSIAPGASMLQVRTPEGLAWYALYPDAYAQAGDAWAQAVGASARVLVVGIRSIGTTLAATVTAALRRRGIDATAFTVRPHGHPFRRSTSLPESWPQADFAIVADEGPGLSGSSMASVANALMGRGFARCAITLFPGHPNGPGAAASATVRQCWAQTPQMVVPWADLRLGGKSASKALGELAQSALGEPLTAPLEDVGAGRWRALVPERLAASHAAAPFLERPKLFARGPSNAGVLVKFAGFALSHASTTGPAITTSEAQEARLQQLARWGWTVAPGAMAHGWMAMPWVHGARPTAASVDANCLRKLGAYIKDAAGPPLRRADREQAFKRLRHILVSNTRELVGDRAVQEAERASDRLMRSVTASRVPSYGDGRMAPHEWIVSGDGMLKTDAGGHQYDHTAIGPQHVWWDIAGASVEWGLGAGARAELARIAGHACTAETAYFRAAYAAFRMGIAKLGSGYLDVHSAERESYINASRYYGRWLRRELLRLNSH